MEGGVLVRTWVVVHREYQPPLSDGLQLYTKEEAISKRDQLGDEYRIANVKLALPRAVLDAEERVRIGQLELSRLKKMLRESGCE